MWWPQRPERMPRLGGKPAARSRFIGVSVRHLPGPVGWTEPQLEERHLLGPGGLGGVRLHPPGQGLARTPPSALPQAGSRAAGEVIVQPAERSRPGPCAPGIPQSGRPWLPPRAGSTRARPGTRSGPLQRLGLVGPLAELSESADEPLSGPAGHLAPASPAARPRRRQTSFGKSSSRGRSGLSVPAAPADTIPPGSRAGGPRLARHRPRAPGSREADAPRP